MQQVISTEPTAFYNHESLCHKPKISFVESETAELCFSEAKSKVGGSPNSFGYFQITLPMPMAFQAHRNLITLRTIKTMVMKEMSTVKNFFGILSEISIPSQVHRVFSVFYYLAS